MSSYCGGNTAVISLITSSCQNLVVMYNFNHRILEALLSAAVVAIITPMHVLRW